MDNSRNKTSIKGIIEKLFEDRTNILIFGLFLFNLFLAYYEFLPNLKDINFWDDANYVNLGRLLVTGALPSFTENPFLAIFYALTYLPYQNSPYWLILSCSLGRFLIFCCLWLGGYLIARELKNVANPLVFLCIVFISQVFITILGNPSDAVFTVLSALGLWQVLAFNRDKKAFHVLWASLFIALAALSRNDGIVLFILFLVIISCVRNPIKYGAKHLALGILPFIILVGGYIALRGVVTGDFSTGISERSYIAFEQGHELVYRGTGIHNQTVDAMLDARLVYGTPAENDYSVFKAILRNPSAYLERLKVIIATLPELYLEVYNKRLAIIFLLLAVRGIIELLRKKEVGLLFILLVWSVYLFTYFLTFFRAGYLRTIYFTIFSLAAFGVSALLANITLKTERVSWTIVLGVISIVGLFTNKLAIYYGGGIFLLGLWIVYILQWKFNELPQIRQMGFLILFCIGLILGDKFPAPKLRTLGQNADEQAAKYLMDNLKPGSLVAAGSPGVVWMSKLEFTSLNGTDVTMMDSGDDFHQWLLDENIQAIYLDYSISRDAPYFWELIKEQTGKGLELVFSKNESSNQILLVKP
jgi:hypothetical protein